MVWKEASSFCLFVISKGFPGGSDGKESACNVGDSGLIPRMGRSPGEGNGNPLQSSWLEHSMDRGPWQSMWLQRGWHDWATKISQFRWPTCNLINKVSPCNWNFQLNPLFSARKNIRLSFLKIQIIVWIHPCNSLLSSELKILGCKFIGVMR